MSDYRELVGSSLLLTLRLAVCKRLSANSTHQRPIRLTKSEQLPVIHRQRKPGLRRGEPELLKGDIVMTANENTPIYTRRFWAKSEPRHGYRIRKG